MLSTPPAKTALPSSLLEKISMLESELCELARHFNEHPKKDEFAHLIVDKLLVHFNPSQISDCTVESAEDLRDRIINTKFHKYKDKIQAYHLKTLPSKNEDRPLADEDLLNTIITLYLSIRNSETIDENATNLIKRLSCIDLLFRYNAFNSEALSLLWALPTTYINTIRNSISSLKAILSTPDEVKFLLTHYQRAATLVRLMNWLQVNKNLDFQQSSELLLQFQFSDEQLKLLESIILVKPKSAATKATKEDCLLCGTIFETVSNFVDSSPSSLPENQITRTTQPPSMQVKVSYLKSALNLHDKKSAVEKSKSTFSIGNLTLVTAPLASKAPARSDLDTLRKYSLLTTEATPALTPSELSTLVWLVAELESPTGPNGITNEAIVDIKKQARSEKLLENLFGKERADFFLDTMPIAPERVTYALAAFCVKSSEIHLLKYVLKKLRLSQWGGHIYGFYKHDELIPYCNVQEILLLQPFFAEGDKEKLSCIANGLSWLIEMGIRTQKNEALVLQNPRGIQLLNDICFQAENLEKIKNIKVFALSLIENLAPLIVAKANSSANSAPRRDQTVVELPAYLTLLNRNHTNPNEEEDSAKFFLKHGTYIKIHLSDEKIIEYHVFDEKTNDLMCVLRDEKSVSGCRFTSLSTRFLYSSADYEIPGDASTLGYDDPDEQHKIKIWDVTTQSCIKEFKDGYGRSLPNGKFAHCNQDICFFDPETQTEVRHAFKAHPICEIQGGLLVQDKQSLQLIKDNEATIVFSDVQINHLMQLEEDFIYFKFKERDLIDDLFNKYKPEKRMIRLKWVRENDQLILKEVDNRLLPDFDLRESLLQIAKNRWLLFKIADRIFVLDLDNKNSKSQEFWRNPLGDKIFKFTVLQEGRLHISRRDGIGLTIEEKFEINDALLQNKLTPSIEPNSSFSPSSSLSNSAMALVRSRLFSQHAEEETLATLTTIASPSPK